MSTWRDGYLKFKNGQKRPRGAGMLQAQKGWDDASFGCRANGTDPSCDEPSYKGPGWTPLMGDGNALAAAVRLGYAQ